ncbi:hypothetical protein CDG81_04710 [Actinopolyspora erythraea]|uniref:Uncharacterized protein n=1 Tax=Actinopolyspora erythraea TaxID=414996 RepID=A0A099D152_9ACTN|nr:DUF5988 family protein [Actinopolyspora erythraea]ASU77733.1 hypothetical protein CDG81_04710 [Actinopolyspora erythraea]KGI79938.1 hypothetical protein IL38_19675 [Actinopolyspora erythraea]
MRGNREVVLEGGPTELTDRHPLPTPPQEEIKIPRRNGYEHYSFSGSYEDPSGDVIPVFRWSYRTRSAE